MLVEMHFMCNFAYSYDMVADTPYVSLLARLAGRRACNMLQLNPFRCETSSAFRALLV